jgi:hypothetical protein
MYRDIATNLNIFTIQIPETVVPSPTDSDYELGFLRRYFCQKANDENGFVFEIPLNVYDRLHSNVFWKTVDLKWRIRGPKETTYKDNGDIEDVGVIQSNRYSLQTSASTIRNIGLYLPNLLQFHK